MKVTLPIREGDTSRELAFACLRVAEIVAIHTTDVELMRASLARRSVPRWAAQD